MNHTISAAPDISWEHIAPHLDEALAELSEPDREALLLRYFKNHDLRTVGATLGISDDAAQKRVSRAVERMREFFAKRGVTVGASGLVVVVSANAIQAAPVGLEVAISTAVLAGTTLITTTTATVTKAVSMATLQKIAIAVTAAILVGTGIYEARQAAELRGQIQALHQMLTNEARTSESAQAEADGHIARLQDDNRRLAEKANEILRLRNEVAQLRNAHPVTDAVNLGGAAEETITNGPPFRTYSATNHVELRWGESGVFGGWKTSAGEVLVVATPTVGGRQAELGLQLRIVEMPTTLELDNGAPVKIQGENDRSRPAETPISVAGFPEATAAAADPSKQSTVILAIEPNEPFPDVQNTLCGVVGQDQIDRLLKAAEQSGSKVRQMSVTLLSGHQAEVTTAPSPENSGSINVFPRISADGKTISLDITCSLNYPCIAIAR